MCSSRCLSMEVCDVSSNGLFHPHFIGRKMEDHRGKDAVLMFQGE